MKKTIATHLKIILFFITFLASYSLKAQLHISGSVHGLYDLYTIDKQNHNDDGIIPGINNFKYNYRPSYTNYALGISYQKKNTKYVFNYNHSAFFHKRCNSIIGRCTIVGLTFPINFNVSLLQRIPITKKHSLYAGFGLGARFIPFAGTKQEDGKIKKGSGKSSPSITYKDGRVVSMETVTTRYVNRFSMYIPLFTGFEYDYKRNFSFYFEAQLHYTIINSLGYTEIEYSRSSKPGEVFQSTLNYGNYSSIGFGVRYYIDIKNKASKA